ncbi:MAG TPA: hypothetical protein VLK03_12805 [Nocardioides sp.]|nr:hypothetical protein [Nocardioides sp.]
MRALVLALVLLVPALAGCSGSGADAARAAAGAAAEQDRDLAQWRAEVAEELGADTFDFAALQQDAAVDCLRTGAQSWTVALALSGDVSTSTLTRIGLEHACPDVVAAFDAAVTAVEGAADPLELVCGPAVELGAEDALTAELACAGR